MYLTTWTSDYAGPARLQTAPTWSGVTAHGVCLLLCKTVPTARLACESRPTLPECVCEDDVIQGLFQCRWQRTHPLQG